MTKWAINIMGYYNDTTGKYSSNTLEELFEQVAHKFEPMMVVGVSVKPLPDDHIIIEKKKVKRSTSVLGRALDKKRELEGKKNG